MNLVLRLLKIFFPYLLVHRLFILFHVPTFPTEVISVKLMELPLVFPMEKMNISVLNSYYFEVRTVSICFSFLNIILLNSIVSLWDIFIFGSTNIPFVFLFPN